MYLACSKLRVQFNRSINIDMITAIKEKVYVFDIRKVCKDILWNKRQKTILFS